MAVFACVGADLVVIVVDEDENFLLYQYKTNGGLILDKEIVSFYRSSGGARQMQLEVSGRVFTGMGKGKYYVGHPEYQKRFATSLGYTPYPGTLNLKLEDPMLIRALKDLRNRDGTKVDSFSLEGESFSSLTCFNGSMDGVQVTLLFIDVTYYNETVAELISPVFLRGRLGLKDGDLVTFKLDVPWQ